MLKSSRKALSL